MSRSKGVGVGVELFTSCWTFHGFGLVLSGVTASVSYSSSLIIVVSCTMSGSESLVCESSPASAQKMEKILYPGASRNVATLVPLSNGIVRLNCRRPHSSVTESWVVIDRGLDGGSQSGWCFAQC